MYEHLAITEDGKTVLLLHFLYGEKVSPDGKVSHRTTPGDFLGPTWMVNKVWVKPQEGHSFPKWKVACMPGLDLEKDEGSRNHVYRRTDDARAVTCPLCKETAVWREAIALSPPLQ